MRKPSKTVPVSHPCILTALNAVFWRIPSHPSFYRYNIVAMQSSWRNIVFQVFLKVTFFHQNSETTIALTLYHLHSVVIFHMICDGGKPSFKQRAL